MKQANIKVVKTHPDVVLPAQAHEHDAGVDLRYFGEYAKHIEPGETKLIPTGLKIQLPIGTEGQIRPRSGLSLKTGLRIPNSPGTIDSGYTDEVKVMVENTGETSIAINNGDRIAQLVVTDVYKPIFIEVEELSDSERGEKGFGSSGIK